METAPPVVEEDGADAEGVQNPPADPAASLDTSKSSCRTRLFPPLISFLPPIGTRLTVLVSDGSNRTAVPEQMLRRLFFNVSFVIYVFNNDVFCFCFVIVFRIEETIDRWMDRLIEK